MTRRFLVVFGLLYFCAAHAWADPYDDIRKKYPQDEYLTGYAEVKTSGDAYRDRRRTEILARLEIAKKIKVTTKSKAVDIMCEQQGKAAFEGKSDCVSQVSEVVEESVDEVLEGSEIAEAGEIKTKGLYYAVAILPRKKAAAKAEAGFNESMEKAKQFLDKARASSDGDKKKEEGKKARAELVKSMAYEGEKTAVLDQVRQRGDDTIRELAEEIDKIEGGR